MVPQILKPIRQKNIFQKKTFIIFDTKVPLAGGRSISSDFVYNINVYDNTLISSDMFNLVKDSNGFELFSKIYNEAGQSIFINEKNLDSIPSQYLNPPLHIANFRFTADLGPISKQYMTMVSFHNPLNISLDSMSPFVPYLNAKDITYGWLYFLLFFSRIPIYVQFPGQQENQYIITNLVQLFGCEWSEINQFFTMNKLDVEANVTFKTVRTLFRQFQNRYVANARTIDDVEKNNVIYNISYNDGRYTGVNSPQASDWYTKFSQNQESNFNAVSSIKCILEMCNLGALYNETDNYTLNDAAVFFWTDGNQIKFTGK